MHLKPMLDKWPWGKSTISIWNDEAKENEWINRVHRPSNSGMRSSSDGVNYIAMEQELKDEVLEHLRVARDSFEDAIALLGILGAGL